jgi:predicted metal-dependent peptidase
MTDNHKPFDLNLHTARLLMREPFFSALSRRIDKIRTSDIPTAGVRVNPDTAQFELFYNPDFMGALSDEHKQGVLMHEFYHLVFEHVTTRKPEGGIRRIDNIAMDLSINGLSEMHGKLPCEADPGPILREGGEPMKGCLPGEGKFAHLPANQTYEWYLAELEKMEEESKDQGEGSPFGEDDDFDVHEGFGEGGGNAQANEIAKERMKDALKKAAEEADKAGNWGSVSHGMKKSIKDRLATKVDWKKMLRYFVRTSQRADKRSTPRRLNKRFPIPSTSLVLWMMGCSLRSTLNWTTLPSLPSLPSSPLILRWPRTRYMCGRRVSVVLLSVFCVVALVSMLPPSLSMMVSLTDTSF